MIGVPTALTSLPVLLAATAAPTGDSTPAPAGSLLAPLPPAVVTLLLCAVAGAATVLLLPGKREGAIRRVGGALLAVVGLIFFGLLFRNAAGNPLDQGAHLYFWPFAAVAVVGAIRVITHPRPVYSALYFVLTTFASAGLFVLLWAEFMAAALILIYAGAILVTYVFVIMLAQQSSSPDKAATSVNEFDTVSREPVVAATVGFAMMAMLIFVISDKAAAISKVPDTGIAGALNTNGEFTQAVGRHLFESHLVNLELAGLILTLATVGAIIIARRKVVGSVEVQPEVLNTPHTPIDDSPHSIPVYGTDNPRQKAYPET